MEVLEAELLANNIGWSQSDGSSFAPLQQLKAS